MQNQMDLWGESGPTFDLVKQNFQAKLEDGTHCPCCGQFAKVYKRKLNSAIALGLVLLQQRLSLDPSEWVHAEQFFKTHPRATSTLWGGGEFSKARYWNLIELADGQRPDGSKRIGLVRLTQLGREFARGLCTVSKYVVVYNGEAHGLSEEQTSIHTALGDRFSYSELMAHGGRR